MRRREMIISAAFCAAAPLILNNPISPDYLVPISGSGKSSQKRFGDGRDWFSEKRFGMFIHWGIYSIPAWHEQHQWRARVPWSEYIKLAEQWNPVKFNPGNWLDLMQGTGMQYITFTTKHHDGFCLWDTSQTGFSTMNTPI